jgi:pyruvate dehydrogenase E1 component
MIPFYIFYSMFGFQRVGDLIWQAADARTRGFLPAATCSAIRVEGRLSRVHHMSFDSHSS